MLDKHLNKLFGDFLLYYKLYEFCNNKKYRDIRVIRGYFAIEYSILNKFCHS